MGNDSDSVNMLYIVMNKVWFHASVTQTAAVHSVCSGPETR